MDTSHASARSARSRHRAGRPATLLVLSLASISAACGAALLPPSAPYDRYASSLREAGLDETALGRGWLTAGQQALTNAVSASQPFHETGYFPPDEAGAVAFELTLRRGRRLVVEVSFDAMPAGRLFVDLFERRDDGPRLVESLEPGSVQLEYDVRRDGVYLLRVQPELLRGGRYTVSERTLASLRFPVAGLDANAIQGAFGAARDAGVRLHEGVDIFAPRGTAVMAVTNGVATVSTNTLGGNVVWLRGRDARFYYAHLDRWAIQDTNQVNEGDVVGYIGNTGNARMTTPHLHFGVYDSGPIDPVPFLAPDDPPAPPAATDVTDGLGEIVRLVPARSVLRRGPDRGASGTGELTRHTVGRVMGASGRAVRIQLADGSSGYLDASSLEPADRPLRSRLVNADAPLLESPLAGAPTIAVLGAGRSAQVLGQFRDFEWVRIDTQHGWLGAAR